MTVSPTPQRPLSKMDYAKTLGIRMFEAIGDSGTKRWSGNIQEDYIANWQDDRRVEIVENMRRGDGTVKAGLRAIKTPLMATQWSITSEDTSKKGEEIRKFVETNLFGMPKRPWKEFLREALGYLDFGYYCFELLWKKEPGGKIWLDDLAPRIPRSIHSFETQDKKSGVTQLIQTDAPEANGKPSMVDIPMSKLLFLTNDKEGDDISGQSILRAPHKHWDIKQDLYKIQVIGAERFGVGLPVVTMDGTGGDQAKQDAEDWGEAMRSNEKSFLVLPNDKWKADILTPSGNPQAEAIISAITHHDHAILHSLLAGFIMLGSAGGGGSYNLGENQLYFFFKACEDMAEYFASQIRSQVIQRLVDVNFGPQEIYPKLSYSPLGDMDTVEMSGVLKTLTDAGLILKDARMIEYVHKTFKLPDIPEETLDALKEADIEKEVTDMEDEEEEKPEEDDKKPAKKEEKPKEDE